MIAGLAVRSVYELTCYRRGKRLWTEREKNIVFTAALDDVLKVYFLGSPAPRSTWFGGLKVNDAAFAAGDTLASHAWTEFTGYTGSRKALTLVHGGAGSMLLDNSAAVAEFDVTGSGTVDGAFTCDVASGTSGLLYGGATFTARSVANGDTLNLTVELTAESA